MEPSGEIEIGWHLGREYWGMGYASEAARAVVEYGFRVNPAIPRLLALVYSANVASQKVAKNVGMEHLGLSSNYYGAELEVFELKRPE
jgi:RimJ/RimL family protein N-acetyltransferase